ncbi:MAG: TonB-dependent receptor, partial [Fidelibacterota bacterium]
YLKIRGFSQDRIGVMLNGIPLNDPEAHAVYWVDHGDILAAAGDVQLQRGVGNSLYGTSVFGGTVNMVTNFHSLFPGFTISTGYGDYIEKSRLSLPSRKFSASYAGGPWRDRGITLYARYSNLGSGGYRVGSGSQQQSYHVGVEKNTSTSLTRFEAIVGQEVTAFAWEGIIPQYGYDLKDREGKYGRRYNFYADPEFNGGRDDANKDVFVQSIVSVQHSRKVRAGLFSLTLYDVNGDGYYEQFKGKRDVVEYNLTDVTASDVHEVDLMRRKWLKNGYRGFVYQFSHPIGLGSMTVGGDARFYRSDHFGKVLEIIGGPAVPGDHRYYSDGSTKTSFSFYVQSRLDITRKIKVMADIRYLGHRYSFDQNVLGAFTHGYRYNLKYDFIDPHLGIQYRLSSRLSLFGNVSTGHREPADGDIYDHDDPRVAPAVEDMNEDYATPLTKEEFLIDYEAGLSFIARDFQGTVNIYRMDFRDELIPVYYRYYDADDVLHANAPRTVYQGVEAAVVSTPYRWLTIDGNVSLSRNRFIEYSGDSLGWGGWGGIADYSQKIIPAYPSFQAKGAVIISRGNAEGWLQVLHAGKQFIDFTNTEEAALHPFTVLNAGVRFEIPGGGSVKPSVSIRINNVLDKLYATFGYNYYDDVDQRRDAFWPGATRNYYVTFSLRR